MLVTNPNGGERLPQKTTYNIRWRSFGFTGNVHIQYSTTGLAGPFTDIVADTRQHRLVQLDRQPRDLQRLRPVRHQISSIGRHAVADTNDAVFSVLPPIAKYYVNDGSIDRR